MRAELAMGHGSAAKRLLLQLKDQGTESYFDDFYLARAEFLLGNRDAAGLHFANLKQHVEEFEAHGRLDFEVALACEIGASDLLRLESHALHISAEGNLPAPVTPQLSPPVGVDAIVSASPAMKEVKAAIRQFAELDLPVLVSGETGTGKELVARAIHDISPRTSEPFIAINCTAIPDTLIESELFGHASGAFTGAQGAYNGIFREAGTGTVFLDEIADISPRLQAALLRVLETNEVRPVGSSTNYPISCRIVAASNQHLYSLVEAGSFRSDLFFRLQRLEIALSALRDRALDIEELSHYFINLGREARDRAHLSRALIEKLKLHDWPGNVRELRNVIERMRVLCSDKLFYDIDDILDHPQLLPERNTPREHPEEEEEAAASCRTFPRASRREISNSSHSRGTASSTQTTERRATVSLRTPVLIST